jgi:hypothetical protein
MDHIYIFHP